MQGDVSVLDQVVVIGYGTVKKRDLTGSISQLSSKEIAKTPANNILETLQGRIAGLDMVESDGQAGSSPKFTLRGNRSLNASNEPLILVDGIPHGSALEINPSDIESVEVLKDASATAIYGTRGANGVILVTTKKGKSGRELFNSDIDQRYEGTFKEVWYANGGNIGAYTEMVQGDTAVYWSHKPLSAEFKARVALKYEAKDINDLYNADGSFKDNRNFIEMHKHNSTTDRAAIFEFRSKRDAFVIRIAEMYLIAAETDMLDGKTGDAVNTLNLLRTARAKAGHEAEMQVSASDLNIDFILDERARELGGELFRWFDLKRTNKLIVYVRLHNTDAKANIQDRHTLRPIPQSQLDVVTNPGDFRQNQGW
jgi:TonB-dependent SusC/RagA subfamily outer membrane receptor